MYGVECCAGYVCMYVYHVRCQLASPNSRCHCKRRPCTKYIIIHSCSAATNDYAFPFICFWQSQIQATAITYSTRIYIKRQESRKEQRWWGRHLIGTSEHTAVLPRRLLSSTRVELAFDDVQDAFRVCGSLSSGKTTHDAGLAQEPTAT